MKLPVGLIGFWAKWKLKLIAGVAILAALAIAGFAAYNIGYHKGKNISAVEIAKYEGNIKDLRGKLATAQGKVTVKYVTQYLKDVQYIDRVEYINRDIIKTVPARAENVSNGFVYVYNQSAQAQAVTDLNKAHDATPSAINDNMLLNNANENFAIAHRNLKQCEALQGWVKSIAAESKKVAK